MFGVLRWVAGFCLLVCFWFVVWCWFVSFCFCFALCLVVAVLCCVLPLCESSVDFYWPSACRTIQQHLQLVSLYRSLLLRKRKDLKSLVAE